MDQSVLDQLKEKIEIYQFDEKENCFFIEALSIERHTELFLELDLVSAFLKENNITYDIKDDLTIQLG